MRLLLCKLVLVTELMFLISELKSLAIKLMFSVTDYVLPFFLIMATIAIG